MNRPTLIDLNDVELNFYKFMIILDKCNGSCNVVDDWSMKICIPSETKQVKVKEIKMIKRIKEAKTVVKHISCDCKCKFNSTTFNSITSKNVTSTTSIKNEI